MAERTVVYPQLPTLPADLPPSLRAWCEAVEQNLQIMLGTRAPLTNSRFLTIQDLVGKGVIPDGLVK